MCSISLHSSNKMDVQPNPPLNKRHLMTQNVFILVCREWLKHMKELKPNKPWNDLKFGNYTTDHSLTRRIAIAFHEKECEYEDHNHLLPDRFRQYWRNHKSELSQKIFCEEQPALFLPANYQLPIFSLNDPLPTFETAYPSKSSQMCTKTIAMENSSSSCLINNTQSCSLSSENSIQNFQNLMNEKDYSLCLNTMIDYLKYGSFANRNNSLTRIALIISKTGYGNEISHSEYDKLIDEYCVKLKLFESTWKTIENAITQKINSTVTGKNELNNESPIFLGQMGHTSDMTTPQALVNDGNAPTPSTTHTSTQTMHIPTQSVVHTPIPSKKHTICTNMEGIFLKNLSQKTQISKHLTFLSLLYIFFRTLWQT